MILRLSAFLLASISVFLNVQAEEPDYLHRTKIKNDDKLEIFSTKIYEGKVKLEFRDLHGREHLIEAASKDSKAKRKYVSDTNDPIEVKPSEGGFKLRAATGDLLWKIKISPTKIKISDNEANQNPFTLTIDDRAGRVKVANSTATVANVKFYAKEEKLKVKSATDNRTLFESEGDRLSAAPGVLTLKRIPLSLRAIIASELIVWEFEASNGGQ